MHNQEENRKDMPNISYVFPNVTEIAQRGGLLERWETAITLGCDYIEIPADLIKNRTEIKKTALNLGGFLTKQAIDALYVKDRDIPTDLKYILHTEPSLTRNDGCGISHQAQLKWYDENWVEDFTEMIILVSQFFGVPAAAIEIHPGNRRNSFKGLVKSIIFILEKYSEQLKTEPIILIENRTGQFISKGSDILDFWSFLSTNYPGLNEKVGFILDVQQLYTVTKGNFIEELELIPSESLKGFHVHHKHKAPGLSDEIPWAQFFSKMACIDKSMIINPEIHHKNKVNDAIKFCEEMLHSRIKA